MPWARAIPRRTPFHPGADEEDDTRTMTRFQLPGLLALVLLAAAPAADGPDEPLPLRRVALPPGRAAAELERANQGSYRTLSRAEFEARVQKAARARRAAENPPVLQEARYRCAPGGDGLIGQAHWVVHNPGPDAAILPLTGLGLALRQARLEDADAVLGDLDRKTLGLLLEKPGRQAVSLEWSARGEARPQAVVVALRLPPCALQSVEVELPEGQTLSVPREVGLVSGPEPSGTAGTNLWRIDCAGQARLELTLRHAPVEGDPPLLFARVHTEQTLATGAAEVQFTAHLDVRRGRVREFRCECSAGIQPYRVSAGEHELESWELLRPAPDRSAELRVRLREPLQAGSLTLTVQGTAAVSAPKPGVPVRWNCPRMRVEGTIPRGETLTLRVPPDVQLADWNSGRFLLMQATTDVAGWQVLTLQGPGTEEVARELPKPKGKPAPVGPRPQARLKMQETEVRVRQHLFWHVQSSEQVLTAHLQYEVTQGRLFRLLVQVPAWAYDPPELTARAEGRDLGTADLVRTWTVFPVDANSSTLVLDLNRGLAPSLPALLTLRLRQPASRGAAMPPTLAFPLVQPRSIRMQEGTLAIRVGPELHAVATASEPEAMPELTGSPGREPLWGKELPDFLYSFRGQAVSGALTLRSRGPQVQGQCRAEAVVRAGRLLLTLQVQAQPLRGNPASLDLWLSAPVLAPETWETLAGTNRVRRVERVGAASGNLWHLVLAQPLREPVTLQTTLDLTAQRLAQELSPAIALLAVPPAGALLWAAPGLLPPPAEPRWEIPLPVLLGAERHLGEIALHVHSGERIEVEARGLQEVPTGARPGGSLPFKAYRYEQTPGTLALRNWAATPLRATDATADQFRFTTTVQRDGRLLHHLDCRIGEWRRRSLPVRLPTGATVLGLRVNGRWVVPPTPVEADAGRSLIDIPVPLAPAGLELELTYTTHAPLHFLGGRVEAPLPALPVTILSLRRTWRLAPELLPLGERSLVRLPGLVPEHTAHGLPLTTRPSDTETDAWLLAPWRPSREARWVTRQRQELAEAASRAWQSLRTNAERRLGTWLHAIVFDPGRGHQPLILDVAAMQQAGLTSDTPLTGDLVANADGTFPWEAAGLVHVPFRSGALLTTVPRWSAWRDAAGENAAYSASLEAAVTTAAAQGQDGSGQFRQVSAWLMDPRSPGDQAVAVRGLSSRLADNFDASWAEYAPLADYAGEGTLLLIRQDVLPGLVLAACGLILVAAWAVRHHPVRPRLAALWIGLLLGTLALLWLPQPLRPLALWPTVSLTVTALVWYLGSLLAAPRRTSGGISSLVSSAAVLLALLAAEKQVSGSLGTGANPAAGNQGEPQSPPTVWILPDAKGVAGQGSVLAPTALLDELDQLSKRGVPALSGAVLLAANYSGQADATGTEWTAEFRLWAFTEETTELNLPLSGVELSEMLLDGAPSLPTAPTAPQTGYGVRVQGRGAHTLRVRFSARAVEAQGEYEVRCSIPRLPRSRMQITWKDQVHDPAVVIGPQGGAQLVTRDNGLQRLEADLGRTTALHVRWRGASATRDKPQMEVREAYAWHFRPEGARLQGFLRWNVRQGSAAALWVRLPDELELARVEAVPAGPLQTAPRLAGWKIEGTGPHRMLRLDFPAPVTGVVQVELELVPLRPFAATAALAIPVPQGDGQPGVPLGISVEGIEATVADHLRVTAADRGSFAAAWKELGQTDPSTLTYRYTVRRGPEPVPLLRLNLNPTPARLHAVQEQSWQIGPRQADFRATLQLTVPTGELTLVEGEVSGGLLLADVRGSSVRAWSAAAGRVQVWLQRPARETPLQAATLEVAGWQLRGSAEAPFTTPRFRLLGAVQQTIFLRVVPQPGWTLEPVKLSTYFPLPEPRPAAELVYVSRDDNAAATFRVTSAASHADAQLLTLLEVRDRRLHFTTHVDVAIKQSDLRTLLLRLHHAEGFDLQLDAERVMSRRDYGRDGTRRSLVLDLQPGVTGLYRLRLSGSRPLDTLGALFAPEVSLPGVATQHWVAAAGPDLIGEVARGLKPVPQAALAAWPAAAERLRRAGGTTWRIEAADWQLRLRPRPTAGTAGAVQQVWADHTAGRPDGRRWVMESHWLLYHATAAEMRLRVPPRAVPLGLALDGQDLAVPTGERSPIPILLPHAAGLRAIRLRWTWEDGAGSPQRIVLAAPQFDGVAEHAAWWTVHSPAEYIVAASSAGVAPATAAARELHRAAAWLPLGPLWAERTPGQSASTAASHIQNIQDRFYSTLRQAEHLLARTAEGHAAGPRGQSLAEWLEELREQNRQLALEHDFDRIRQRAERRSHVDLAPPEAAYSPRLRAGLLTERGTPTHWVVQPGAGNPHVGVEPRHRQGYWLEFLLSLLASGLAALAWRLQHVPGLLDWLHRLWPEELALIGLVAASLSPLVSLGAAIMGLSLAARGYLLVVHLKAWWARARHVPPASRSAHGSLPGYQI